MVNTKLKTAIVNCTQQDLVLRVGNRSCFAKLATIGVGGELTLEIDIHWTNQEFSLEPQTARLVAPKVFLNLDDLCDFERVTVTISEWKLQLERVPRSRVQVKDDVVEQRPLTGVGPEVQIQNRRSYFTWPLTWPKFHYWKFWSLFR